MDINYEVGKVTEKEFSILKSGVPTYHIIVDEDNNPSCNCPAFTYRGICKHIGMLKECYDIGESLQKRIPRYEISKLYKVLEPIVSKYTDKWEIVGSYRRGKPTSKDIDIIALIPDPDKWNELIDELEQLPNYERKVRGDQIARGYYEEYPLDINRVNSQSEWASQLLYRTGSKEHNIKMRALAKAHGWTLNEHGMFDNESGKLISEPDWEEINYFNALMIPYKTPEER